MTAFGADDPRLHRALQVLEKAGVRGARVSSAGHENEIVAVSVPAGELDPLLTGDAHPIVGELKGLGFRYVAIDLAPVE